ncbi:MAG TPA: DUF2277 domain-containing protein [Gaiellaceae bacterium]|nr:DUF2277 domain-containing protein [Gaiellaceae bacterium]
MAELAFRGGHGIHGGMCRNIKTLYNFEPVATTEEVRLAAEQYVRKVSGFTKPSKANEHAFAHAVEEVASATQRLLDALVTTAPPRDREVEAERARARAARRFAAA